MANNLNLLNNIPAYCARRISNSIYVQISRANQTYRISLVLRLHSKPHSMSQHLTRSQYTQFHSFWLLQNVRVSQTVFTLQFVYICSSQLVWPMVVEVCDFSCWPICWAVTGSLVTDLCVQIVSEKPSTTLNYPKFPKSTTDRLHPGFYKKKPWTGWTKDPSPEILKILSFLFKHIFSAQIQLLSFSP